MHSLIVAEKPSVALKIAMSLADVSPIRKSINGVSYYEVLSKGDSLYVVAAVGHLFTIHQKSAERKLPVFDLEWVPSYQVNKESYFTKKYLDTIKEVGKGCDSFINACDYDIEGTVIGTNIIKYVKGNDVNKDISGEGIRRMHFSTTTRSDLLASYGSTEQFDARNFDAGETRHVLDWIWGINLSRALMHAIYSIGTKKVMSIGRVQGPTLAILAEREKEIKAFKPQDYWKVFAVINGVDFENRRGAIFENDVAEEIAKKAKKEPAKVEKVDVSESSLRPFPPFDLTSLQLEANRALGIDPSKTLALAQSLYERSYISYPRTSSQKLPYALNLPRIINDIAKNPLYKALADQLIKESRFKPAEGGKDDDAHPAIYPTGEVPSKLIDEEARLYDMIVRRFLSVFADWASIEHASVIVAIGEEKYDAKGSRVTKSGWLSFYSYYKPDERTLPKFDEGAAVAVDKAQTKKLTTKPPDRFSKASIIALLERKDLGTKATRAAIIDTLFNRGYTTGKRIEVTEYGMSVYSALIDYCEPILDEAMTRKLEEDMEEIIKGKTTKSAVIAEGKDLITKIIELFINNEMEISESLKKGLEKTSDSSILGKCPKDGGNLIIKYSRAGKQFVSCANWPACNTGYPLPGSAKIVPTGKVCPHCKTPIVKVFRFKKVFEMDLDPNCITKKDWAKKKEDTTMKVPEIKKASELKSAVPPVEDAAKTTAPLPMQTPAPVAQGAGPAAKEIKKPSSKKKAASKPKSAAKKK